VVSAGVVSAGVDALAENCDEHTLEALCVMARGALEKRAAAAVAGRTEMGAIHGGGERQQEREVVPLHTSASGSELSANPARWEEVAGGSGDDSEASAASMEPVVIANTATMSSSGAPKSLSGNPNDHVSEMAIL